MENKIGKVTVNFGDGRVNEVNGESIIAIGLTNTSDHVKVECNVEGGFSANMLIAVIRSMRNIFKDEWAKAIAYTSMENIVSKMFADEEQPEEQPEEPTEEPTGEPAAEGGNHEDD